MNLSYFRINGDVSQEQLEYLKNKYGSVSGTIIDYKDTRTTIHHSFLGTPELKFSNEKTKFLIANDPIYKACLIIQKFLKKYVLNLAGSNQYIVNMLKSKISNLEKQLKLYKNLSKKQKLFMI